MLSKALNKVKKPPRHLIISTYLILHFKATHGQHSDFQREKQRFKFHPMWHQGFPHFMEGIF